MRWRRLIQPPPLVLSGASGVGKTTIARRLTQVDDRYRFSISATTRSRRASERDGVDYWFVTKARFATMIERGEMVEWAEVHGHLYGTPREELEGKRARWKRVVLDIDVQGARQIKDAIPDAILIFLLPPSPEALAARLTARGTETDKDLVRRLRRARKEMDLAPDFDFMVINDDLERAVGQVRALAEGFGRSGRHRDAPGLLGKVRREILLLRIVFRELFRKCFGWWR